VIDGASNTLLREHIDEVFANEETSFFQTIPERHTCGKYKLNVIISLAPSPTSFSRDHFDINTTEKHNFGCTQIFQNVSRR